MRDPLLLYISTYLASQHDSRSSSRAQPLHPDSGSGGSGGAASSSTGGAGASSSGGAAGQALSPEANLWQLQWDELEIERQVGRGSFGAVYKARWHETTVAVKVLIDQGAALLAGGMCGCCIASNRLAPPAAAIAMLRCCQHSCSCLLS